VQSAPTSLCRVRQTSKPQWPGQGLCPRWSSQTGTQVCLFSHSRASLKNHSQNQSLQRSHDQRQRVPAATGTRGLPQWSLAVLFPTRIVTLEWTQRPEPKTCSKECVLNTPRPWAKQVGSCLVRLQWDTYPPTNPPWSLWGKGGAQGKLARLITEPAGSRGCGAHLLPY
jgi:hypothetical protein